MNGTAARPRGAGSRPAVGPHELFARPRRTVREAGPGTDTWSGNERAIRAFSKAGFREEGRRRSTVLVAGERHDTVLFGMLREEWPETAR
ncbi:GNAT family N-acetyltransferase [Streptomyces sp. NPDC090021]|uniref:GNAT family N-acetyltransferase n=1 Tax=Streptomyces sp. NPDC090021 TaxID=3365919 RepID=UPI003814E6D1